MQNVLIVKNDELFLNTMSDRLALNDSVSFLERIGHNIPTGFFDLEVYKSLNGQQAIKILGQYPIDIVITDLKMPKINGFELILHMNNHYPNTPIIVLTDIAPITMNKFLCEDGISHYIERPFSLDLIKKSIVEVLILKLLNPDHCVYSGISISSLMQLISTAKMTYTIYIKESENIGRLYMLYGKLIGAETKNNKGEDAVYEMFGWKKPMLLLEPSCNNAEETIKVSLMQILKKSLKALHGLDKISSDKLLKQETPQGEKSQQVKSLYRKLAKRFHPDVNADFSEEMKNYWLLITDAYNKGEVDNLKILSLITSNLFKESTRLHTENPEDQQVPVEDKQFEETRKLEEQESEKQTEEISEADEDKVEEDIKQDQESEQFEPEAEAEVEVEAEAEVEVEDETETETEKDEEPVVKDTFKPEDKPEGSFDRARFKKLLIEFGGINGFVSCSIFDPGGEEIVSYGTDPDKIAFRAASALSELFSYCSQATEVIGMNKAGELILQTKHSTIIMDSLDTEAFGRYLLMLILDKKGNMALTKLALKKILPELRKECVKS